MTYIVPKKWASFQHYKDRSPSWLKLHKSLLDDYDFHSLQVASRALAPMLWLLASEYDEGKLPLDYDMISFRLRSTPKEVKAAVSPLIDKGFFILYQDASGSLAECLPREEGEESKRRGRGEPCPHDEIKDLYHEILCNHPKVKIWTDSRKSNLNARWKSDEKRQTLDYWKAFFGKVSESKFLTGQVAGKDGGKSFIASLDWLVMPENFAKVIEGRYD